MTFVVSLVHYSETVVYSSAGKFRNSFSFHYFFFFFFHVGWTKKVF